MAFKVGQRKEHIPDTLTAEEGDYLEEVFLDAEKKCTEATLLVEQPAEAVSGVQETTILPAGCIFRGTVEAQGDIVVKGDFQGDIVCHSRLNIIGRINGSVTTRDLDAAGAVIVGNVTCSQDAQIVDGTQIYGDVKAASLVLSGKVKGNVDVQGQMVIQPDAVVVGDLTGGVMEIKSGAYISGIVTVAMPEMKEEKIFDRVLQLKAST